MTYAGTKLGERAISRERSILVAAAVCAALLLAAFGVVQAIWIEEAAAKPGKQVILSPKHGQRVPARPLGIRLRAKNSARTFKVQLNGQPIARHFSEPDHGVRRLKASLSHGLRHGRNRLHVRIGKRSDSTHFRVRRNRHLVGAGLTQELEARGRVFLEGSHKIPKSGGRGRGVSYRWRTIAGPRHHGGGQARGAAAAIDQPDQADTPTPTFDPTLPGNYTLKLTVTSADGTKASDRVAVQSLSPPVVPVDTMAFMGPSPNGEIVQSGIKVGNGPCPGSPGCYPSDGLHHWAQLVTLDRKTLTPVGGNLADLANKMYDCAVDHCPQAQQPQLLANDLARLGPDTIAIVANPQPDPAAGFSGGCNTDDSFIPAGLEPALKRIGVSPTGFDDTGTQNLCSVGAISAIGVPGTKPGEGDWHTTEFQPGGGRMEGYFVRNNDNLYTFEAQDHVDFDTQAVGSTDSQNVIQVGHRTFTQSFDGGIRDGGGFQVVVLDAQTLEGESHWYETDHSDRSALIGQLAAMRQTIHDANATGPLHRKLVFVASLGKPAIQYYQRSNLTNPDDEVNRQLSQLVDEVERLGGTRNAFYGMLDPALYTKSSYTLFSVGASGAGHGEEAVRGGISGTGTGPLNTARMSGTLARTGPNYGFRLQGSLQVGPDAPGADPSRGTSQLMHVAYQRPSPWPEEGDPGRTAAIKWIGEKEFGVEDLRSKYWTSDFATTNWEQHAYAIQGLEYDPAQADNFSAEDLEWAKAEIAGPLRNPPLVGGEIAWLISTHNYLAALSKPFENTQLKSWANLQSISDDINAKVEADRKSPVESNVKAVFNFARGLLDLAPEVGEALYAANDLYELVVELVEINGKPATEDFPSSVGSVGTDLATRLQKAQAMFTNQIPNMIASDYGRLRTVGACASDRAPIYVDCPFDQNDWKFSPDAQTAAGNALVDGTNAWAYGELLPAKYNLYRLPPWWRTGVNGTDSFAAHGPGCNLGGCVPFGRLPASDQVARPIYRNIPSYGHTITNGCRRCGTSAKSSGDTWQIDALGFVSGEGTFDQPYTMSWPDASVTNKIFGHGKGQLGLDPEQFFARSFTPRSLEHYKWQDTLKPEWCGLYPDVCASSNG